MTLWYLSFASETEFLGATVIEADSGMEAWTKATLRGLNPGGEVMMLQVPPAAEKEADILIGLNRLVSAAELRALGARRLADCRQEIQEAWDREGDCVREEHNTTGRSRKAH
jgi:hypothetical protein